MEFDIGLSTIGEEVGIGRVDEDGLRVEVNGEFEVVVDESLLRLGDEIGRH
ncbi:hypothetical protein Hanom_Chr17g01562211 [Helianthus anomalus]